MIQRRLIFTLLAALMLTAPVALTAQPAKADPPAVGTIASTNGDAFTMSNGVMVIMNPGTVVKPTGMGLQSGETVAVLGHYDANGALQADIVYVGTQNERARYGQQNGWFDQGGNFHTGRPSGWYDQNGNFHTNTRGWYDRDGNFHVEY